MKTQKQRKELAIVYLVAGISSRFGGKIKAFAKITKNKTLIEYSLAQALKSGFSKIIFVVGNKTKKPFKEKFKNSYKGTKVFYALQSYDKKIRDKPWGTTDAICCANYLLNCPFVVCNGDDIYGENSFKVLAGHLKNSDEEATLGYKLISVIPEKGQVIRGIAKSRNGYIIKIRDVSNIMKSDLKASKTKPDDLCTMGIFALHPETLKFLKAKLKEFKKKNKGDRKAEYILPNALSELIETKKIKMKIYPAADKWLGITNPGDEREVMKRLLEGNRKKI